VPKAKTSAHPRVGWATEGLVTHVLSTDRVRAYKPDPRAYQMGVDAFGLPRDAIAFGAFGGWTPRAPGGSAIGRSG